MSELDLLERTLELARAELAPSPADDHRARQALGLSSGAVPPLARARGAEAGALAALRVLGPTGAVVGALLLGSSFGGGYWLGRNETPGASPTSPASTNIERPRPAQAAHEPPLDDAPPELVPAEESPAAADAPVERSVRPRARAHRPRVDVHKTSRSAEARPDTDPTEPTLGTDSELALLRRVEKSLRSGDAAFALALVGELDERFPKTQLGEEREAARVMAHCALGDAGARLRAERFLRERSLSVYAERVREACAVSTK
jgi:hypothetical protein